MMEDAVSYMNMRCLELEHASEFQADKLEYQKLLVMKESEIDQKNAQI
jgi:hypothetical protein